MQSTFIRWAMKFQIGDKVVVKHTGEAAEVVELLNDEMAMLLSQGVTFPAYLDELAHPYAQWFSPQKIASPAPAKKHIEAIPREKAPVASPTADGLWFTFIPVFQTDEFGGELVDQIKIHLVNRTPEAYHFIYALEVEGGELFSLKSEIQPFEDFYLHDIPFDQVNDSPLLCLECALKQSHKGRQLYKEVFFKMKPRAIFLRIEEMRSKGNALFSHLLFERYPDKKDDDIYLPVPDKGNAVPLHDFKGLKDRMAPPRQVVDLHIEVLAADYENMSVQEMVQLQLHTFDRFMDLALLHGQKKLIVIHGIGSGKLRDMIHDRLRQEKSVADFYNRYHPAYGYGATEVHFK